MEKKRKIILYPNAERDIGLKMAFQVAEMLKKQGRRIVFCPMFDDCIKIGKTAFETKDLIAELSGAEMIITFGGDGTILRAARAAAHTGVPILGINLGGKGFLAELEKKDLQLINNIAEGNYKIESRMMLDVIINRNEETIYREFALNDVVIRGDNKVVDLTVYGDGKKISQFSGDGAVIATPTGSTAYSMSAGGPIVEDAADNIIVTPICAHELMAKPLVLISDRRVCVELGKKKHNPAHISVDGGDNHALASGDVISVFKSKKSTRLVRLSNRSFYKKVSEKLGERP